MYSGVISIFSERIKKELPITIHGDGQQTRDFVNVKDVVQANLLAMSVGPRFGGFVALNVATGCQISLLDLVDTLGSLCECAPDVSLGSSRSGDIRHSLADISKIQAELGYSPMVDLRTGLADLIR